MTLGRRNFREIYAPSRRNLEEINKRNLRLFRKKSSPEPKYTILPKPKKWIYMTTLLRYYLQGWGVGNHNGVVVKSFTMTLKVLGSNPIVKKQKQKQKQKEVGSRK